ncbi:unnamed protein product, partial [Caretta caretta]
MYGILQECQSAWNTPVLPVQKPHGTYRLVQDLRAVNERVKTLHPLVPNPYTLLVSIGGQYTHFSVLNLKDAFFTIPVATPSQEIFSFEWEDRNRVKKQLCWTVLAQGFKNSPTLFGQALARDLAEWDNEEALLLQYVDDLLIAAVGQTPCLKATVSLLNFIGLRGYRVARSKAQIALPEVRYLGFHVQQEERQLSSERKEAICQVPTPSNRKRLRAFLGMAGFCRIWIPEFGLWAKPLYDCVKGTDHDPFCWTPEADRAFKILKRKLMEAPALGLLDLSKPFQLYVHEQKGVALGVLTQLLGAWRCPVAYFSKQLDQVAKCWPACLRAVAATALVLEEAEKLTLGGVMQIYTPHMVRALLDAKGGLWLTQAWIARYQAKLLENSEVTLQPYGTHFTSKIIQSISNALQIPWKLHTPWRLQASGVVLCTNQTLKRHLSKVCQEASLRWPDALPLILLRIHVLPKGRLGLSPFEIMFGRAWPMNGTPVLSGEWELGNGFLSQYMYSLSAVLLSLHRYTKDSQPLPLDSPVHSLQPGDSVLVRTWKEEPLQEKWKGPYTVLLISHTAAKIEGHKNWIHHSRLKAVP